MKIGIVCNALANSGDMERYTLDIIRGLVASGHEVTVFTRKIDQSLQEASLVKAVKINTSFLPKRLRDFYVSFVLPSLRKTYPVDVMLGCCRSKNVDVVICGGTHPGFLKATGKKKSFFDRLVLPFEKTSYEEAKCVVAHSPLVEQEILTYYSVPREKLFFIPPPVDLDVFDPKNTSSGETGSARSLSSFPQLKGKTIFLFVSSSHARKGFNLLEEYFEKTDLPVALAVAGRPIPKKNYRNICYVGYEKNMAPLYSQADFSILASTYEPFGLVPIESLCMGVPVVISENLGCKDYISPEVKEEFNPFSIGSLDVSIRNCLKHKSSMQERAKELPSEKFLVDFSLKKHIKKLIQVCELARKENAN